MRAGARLAAPALALALAAIGGCARVPAWQRGDHARRAMTAKFGDDAIAGRHRAKVVETKTGGGAANTAPGGGCGCSQ